jgi:hypothetical protein
VSASLSDACRSFHARVAALGALATFLDGAHDHHHHLINLHSAHIGGAGSRALSRVVAAPELAHGVVVLDLSGCNLAEYLTDILAPGVLFEALAKHQHSLVSLDLSGNLLTSAVGRDLADVLPRMTRLASLDLSRNNLHSAGVTAIAEAIDPEEHPHCAVSWLCLAENSAGIDPAHPHPSIRAAVALSTIIRKSRVLGMLDLSYNELGGRAVSLLAEALAENDGLYDLRLDGNAINVDVATALAEAIGPSSSLTRLGLRGTSLTGDGAVALAEALRRSPVLSVLDLRDAGVSHHGKVALARAVLPANRCAAEAASKLHATEKTNTLHHHHHHHDEDQHSEDPTDRLLAHFGIGSAKRSMLPPTDTPPDEAIEEESAAEPESERAAAESVAVSGALPTDLGAMLAMQEEASSDEDEPQSVGPSPAPAVVVVAEPVTATLPIEWTHTPLVLANPTNGRVVIC